MTEEEYYKRLKINDIIYDDQDNYFVKMSSVWSEDKVPQHKSDSLWAYDVRGDSYGGRTVSFADIEHWHYVTDESPMEVKFKWLQFELSQLQEFIHSRLK